MVAITNGTKYALISDETEALRLNKQHGRIKLLFDGRWLPSELELRYGDKVLDSGAGTGIWALDIASSVPNTVHIDAIDITDRLFPLSPPPNVHLSTGNILELPESYSSVYTLIHQRFLTAAFSDIDWRICLQNMFEALRPGGWLKMEELRGLVVFPSGTPPNSQRLFEMTSEIERARGIDFAAVEKIEAWLNETGFVDVQVEPKRWRLGPGERYSEDRDVIKGVWRALRMAALQAGNNLGFSDNEWIDFLNGLDKEYSENEVYIPIYSFVARKPSS